MADPIGGILAIFRKIFAPYRVGGLYYRKVNKLLFESIKLFSYGEEVILRYIAAKDELSELN